MISIDKLLDMVATEALEESPVQTAESEMDVKLKREAGASSFQFSLELIRYADGSYRWIE